MCCISINSKDPQSDYLVDVSVVQYCYTSCDLCELSGCMSPVLGYLDNIYFLIQSLSQNLNAVCSTYLCWHAITYSHIPFYVDYLNMKYPAPFCEWLATKSLKISVWELSVLTNGFCLPWISGFAEPVKPIGMMKWLGPTQNGIKMFVRMMS